MNNKMKLNNIHFLLNKYFIIMHEFCGLCVSRRMYEHLCDYVHACEFGCRPTDADAHMQHSHFNDISRLHVSLMLTGPS